MFFVFLTSISGFAVVFRTIETLFGQALIPKQHFLRILSVLLTIFVITTILILFFIPNTSTRWLALWFEYALIFAFLCCAPFIQIWRNEKIVCEALLPLLTALTLAMKSGKSYRKAVSSESRTHTTPQVRAFLEEVERQMCFQTRATQATWLGSFTEIIEDLAQIDRDPHFAIQKLEFLREREQRKFDLGLKIAQAKLQARVQSFVMICIYLACLFWAVVRGDMQRMPRLLFFSTLWFFCGCFWVHRIGEKTKWHT